MTFLFRFFFYINYIFTLFKIRKKSFDMILTQVLANKKIC